MSQAKRHHYVFRAYLEQWESLQAEGERAGFWVYDRSDLNSPPRFQRAKDTACITHFYRFQEADGSYNTNLENIFGIVESEAMPVIRKLSSIDAEPNKTDWERLVALVAFSSVRVPNSIQQVEKMAAIFAEEYLKRKLNEPNAISEFLDAHPEADPEAVQQGMKAFLAGEISVSLAPQKGLAFSLESLSGILRVLAPKDWSIIHAVGNVRFVTSDTPVNVFVPADDGTALIGAGWAHDNAEIWMPLSPLYGVHFGPHPVITSDEEAIEHQTELNRRLIAGSDRWVFSSEKTEELRELIEEVSHVRTTIDEAACRAEVADRLDGKTRPDALPARVAAPDGSGFGRRSAPEAGPVQRKVGRNESCPCGSGLKSKRCCYSKI